MLINDVILQKGKKNRKKREEKSESKLEGFN